MKKQFGGSLPSPWSDYDFDQDALDSVNGTIDKPRYLSTSRHDPAPVVPPRCYTSHPPLPLVVGGDTWSIYGGSCSTPVVLDADIYIGFDYMKPKHPRFPWNPVSDSAVLEIAFPITDMNAPSNPDEFKKMITWVCNQVRDGKKIHAGCIGGHGRTGTFLAAVVAEIMGEKDAITYVRENYCKKAVESAQQIAFLGTHYGITPIKGSKSDLFGGYGSTSSASSGKSSGKWGATTPPSKASTSTGAWKTSLGSKTSNVVPLPSENKVAFRSASKVIKSVTSARCIWNKT